MNAYFTVRPTDALHPSLKAEDALEHCTDLDRARDVALSLCQELKTDVGVYQHFGTGSCLWELYDHTSYG